MIQAYSKRLLSPYTGQVQIVESDRARALTLGGADWGIQFRFDDGDTGEQGREGPPPKKHYARVANIRGSEIQRIKLPYHLDSGEVEEQILELADYIKDVTLPFAPADGYEYWLLDEKNEQPLALIYSCVKAEEMAMYPRQLEWTATPASVSAVEKTPEELRVYTPPVNYQLEQLVKARAGRNPRAVWMKRRPGLDLDFPPCLVSEGWEEEEHERLCRRFIARLAPRLLMLHGLEQSDRLRLEQEAKAYALEVEQFFPLYPDIADQNLMSSIRIEARLRLAAGEAKN
ncbi:MAG: hypothetical protein ACFCVA_16340 [Gammaproteobacteria bacterium]